jgi:hypothetical protein
MMGLTFALGLVVLCLGTKVFIHGGFPTYSFVMVFGLGGPRPSIRGRFGCGLPFKVFLCYVL